MANLFVNLEQASRIILTAFEADIPVALWGPPGVGKSSVIAQVTKKLVHKDEKTGKEVPYKLYDVRLSDKEPSDLGGIPFPSDGRVRFLMNDLLPWDTDEYSVVLFDEYDRADLSVQNPTLQIILDRTINGHRLSKNARVILAGNGTTDTGTSPLSRAAANRMCHIYIETGSPQALDSWDKWASENGTSDALRGFAKFKQSTWSGQSVSETGKIKKPEIEEIAYPTPRSFDFADRLLVATESVPFKVSDIIKPMVAGCVGVGPATEFLNFRDTFDKAPSPEEIVKNPKKVRVPKEPDVLAALTVQLCDYAKRNKEFAEAIAEYGLRWAEEPGAYLFKRLADAVPNVIKTKPYQEWMKRDRAAVSEVSAGTMEGFCLKCKKKVMMLNPKTSTLSNGRPVVEGTCPECGTKTNRIGEPAK